MQNYISKYVDITPLISYERLAELICLCLAFDDDYSTARLPMNVVDLICDLIDSNSSRLNELVTILDIAKYDTNPYLFRRCLSDSFNIYVSNRLSSVNFSSGNIELSYDDVELTDGLNRFGNGLTCAGNILARMIDTKAKSDYKEKVQNIRKRMN